MDSSAVAISQAIAQLACEDEIKKCLQALFNEELFGSSSGPAPKSFYVKQVELCSETWTPGESDKK